MDEPKRLVEIANDRLRKGKIGVSLELQGKQDWIYVRGTFPPKPGSKRIKPHQQRIALRMRANSREAVKQAEMTVRQIGLDLNLDNFSWAKFSDAEPTEKTIGDWLQELEAWFWSNRERNASTLNTWAKGYAGPLSLLPPEQELTIELLQDWVIENSSPRSRRRGHYCTCAKRLAKMAGLPGEIFKDLGSGQSQKPVNPRDLPNDATIAQTRNAIQDPGWQYLYGLMATYGLRNHECFALDLIDFPVVRVRQATKTGTRAVKPLYPEWAEAWRLNEPLYPHRAKLAQALDSQNNQKLGIKITGFFERAIGWSAYNLRHCYARRCAEFGIAPSVACRLMGHSLLEHERTYKAWIGERFYLDAFDKTLSRGDRPLPPSV